MATCDWCGKHYTEAMHSGEVFWTIKVWGTDEHTICDDCKKHLKKLMI